jgi:hypothetical protein
MSQDPLHARQFGDVMVIRVPVGSMLLYSAEEKEWIAPAGSVYRYEGSVTCGCLKKKSKSSAVDLNMNLDCHKNEPKRKYAFTLFTPKQYIGLQFTKKRTSTNKLDVTNAEELHPAVKTRSA